MIEDMPHDPSLPPSKLQVKVELLKQLKHARETDTAIDMLSLATADGFNICFSASRSQDFPRDKMAALASSLSALSESATNQLEGDRYSTTIIESTQRHIILTRTPYQNKDCVLTMVTTRQMPLATARFKLLQLSKAIAGIGLAGRE